MGILARESMRGRMGIAYQSGKIDGFVVGAYVVRWVAGGLEDHGMSMSRYGA